MQSALAQASLGLRLFNALDLLVEASFALPVTKRHTGEKTIGAAPANRVAVGSVNG